MVRLAAGVTAALVLAGCAGSAESGYLPHQSSVGEIPGARLEFSGTITALDNGCLMLDRGDGTTPWIVWPPGAAPGDAGGASVNGELYGIGDAVEGTGTLAVLADLPGGADDSSYFGGMGSYCDGHSAGVAVLDSIVHAAS